MDRRHALALLLGLAAVVAAFATLTGPAPSPQRYPEGAGPNHINFSALEADDANVSHAPRDHWDSYTINYTAPDERPLVEGDYYINATTGEVISVLWDGAEDYRNGRTYAYVQPADRLSEHQRAEFEDDDAFVYHDATDAYYRYDPYYGQLAPTNMGRHTEILERYTWTASDTTTHHGVPVITYRVTGKHTDGSRVPPAVSGTLRLGAEEGIIYAFDITLDDGERTYNYTYDVRPAPFPEHGWVDTARQLAGNTSDS